MNHNLIKKYSVGLVLAIYVLAYFLQSLSFFDLGAILNKTYAEDQLDYTNLVAIFVDDKIYDDIKSDIKRYAQTYIQGDDKNDRYNAISNSKAIVMPIDVDTVTAPEITKILENMYFDGISSEPSKLIGTVLVGDIPLPVVNQDGFIYPTIYPYVDFEEQKFIWNDKSKYFTYNDNPDGQAEIRHGIINFDKISDYDDYFDKLKNYSKEPSKFIDKSIWYDDFIANKQYFYKEAMNSYLNNFIFAEDIGYRRYTDLMVKLMQGAHNEMISDLLSGFDGMDELNAATTEMNTPTMTLKKMIDNGYLKSYTSLMGPKQLDNMMTNVETANRWTEVYTGSDGKIKTRTALDNHYMKIELKDETLLRMNGGLDPLIITFNNVLEDIVNDKIQEEKYWMNEVIPLTYLKYDGTQMRSPFRPWKFNCMWKDYEAYENYFFGTKAKNITSMKETSIYRGTFRNFDNIDNLTIDDIQNSNYPASDISDKVDLEKKSIGGSYDIFATQVEANRGYNINNTVKELDTYNTKKIAKRELWKAECTFEFWGVCWTKRIWRASTEDGEKCNPSDEEEQGGCELPSDFAIRNRGGASPLNLSGMNGWKSPYIFQNAILPIFDIAGSKEIYTGENEANNFKGVKKYSRLIKQKFVPDGSKYYTKNEDKRSPDPYQQGYDSSMGEDMKFTNWEATGDPANPGWLYSVPKSANDVNYFNKFDNSAHWENDILKIKKNNTEICVGNGEVFTYKTIDSRVVNDLTTKDQIGGMGFKPFQDAKSPVKIFYNGIQDKIARTNDALSSQINTLQLTTSGGIVDNILNLSQYIDDINSEVDDIINMPTSTITALSTTDIQSLASKWSNTIDTPQVEYISGSVNDIKDQFMDIDRFISNFGHTLISEYINTQIYNFVVNKWNLIFYTSWSNNIATNLDLIKTRFHSMEGLLDNVKIKYDNISDINLKTAQLTQKLAAINAAVSSGSAPIGCISDYVNLCTAITKLSNDLILHKVEISDKIDEIENFVLDNQHFKPFVTTRAKINNSTFNNENANIKIKVGGFNTSNDYDLVEKQDGMNLTTSDRPIDSPKYITFKGIGGDLVNFIYPNIYKSEIFSGSSNILKLKSPEQIADAIRTNLRESVKKYNEYLLIEKNNKNKFYSKNSTAYNKLAEYDTLASPISSRPYKLMDEDFLINELEKKLKNGSFFSGQMGGYEPIEFIAHMLYDQNIGWKQRKIGNTIQDDLHNIRDGFDVNDKISYTVANYLISDNNEGNFITPGYRDNGYEVVFINSDGSDYIDYKDEPTFVKKLKASSNNFKKPAMPVGEQSDLEESLSNNCNIPEDGGVMLFDLQTGDSPWLKALWCWREQIRTKPREFSFNRSSVQGPPITFGDKGDNAGEIISKNLGTDNIQSQYMNQLDMLDTDDENQEVLDNSSPGDYQKLNKIAAYTQIKTNKQNINADNAKGLINISSSVELGDVEFHIENVGDSIINFDEEIFTVDPFNKKSINFNINNPKDGINVVMFHMCLPGTQDLKNCVKKSLRLNVIPGEIKNIEIKTPGNKILQGSKMPISIVGTDAFGNNVGQLVSQKFTISTSTGSIIYQSTRDNKIKFSNFNKSNFVLDAKNIDEGTQIRIDIDGYINGNKGTQASSIINVAKGEIKIKYKNGVINNDDQIKIKLPSQNEYTYKDSYNLNQTNLITIPKIELNLVDNNGDKIDIKSIISISSKNGFIKAGEIETRKINKTQNGTTFEVNQNRFKGSSSYIISGGNLIVYLMPKFKAGDDILFLSMPGIDDIQIPIVISPAPASMIDLATKKTEIAVDSSTKGHLKIMDNWGNTITQDTTIKLGATGPISISGLNNSSIVINIKGGKYNFDINAKKQGGAGFVYAMINNLSLDEQKPGNATVTVQNRILPDKDLNIMYLNLFGSDWGNQRGYMSENNKYIQKLITNSKKLLTTTTQLISPAKIKKFAIITDNKLQINNIEEKSIKLNLEKIQGNKNIQIQIEDIGDINVASDSFKIKKLNISEENIETTIKSTIKNYDKDNIIIYIPEVTDSIITQNDVKNNSIYINNTNIFDIKNGSLDQKLDIKWTNKTLAGYQLRDATIDGKKIGRIIISANKNNTHIETIVANEKYDYNKVWLNGSTNQEGVGFYKIDSALSDNTLGYESIQDSINPTLGLGFRGDFKNITNFGAGENIGEATLPFSSEFLINIGDPLLKRIDDNKTAKIYDADGNLETDTGFDKGLGEVVYSEPGKTIFKIKKIDFNNDGLEDIIVAFTDGTIKILKNYGGNTPFEQLGDLMILADGIKDIIIGDVDGNKYQDIIIWSKGDTLRVYKNNKGIFDVDGYPICINTNVKDGIISKTPQDISGIFQIFFEDMDQDGSLDIITNDKLGYIKIFYGGNDNIDNLDNYVSSDKYKCDDNRYQRENQGNNKSDPNTKMVYRFSIRVNENTKVLDKSRIHRDGINPNNDVTITPKELGIDNDSFSASNMDNIDSSDVDGLLSQAMNFDVNAAEQGFMVAKRYKDSNFGKIPTYEDIGTGTETDIKYVEIGCLTGTDPIKIYKKYEDINGDVLEDGDIVKVSITMLANDDFLGTWIDQINGPWKISLLENGMLEHFWFDSGSVSQSTIEDNLKFHWDMANNSRYMIDNIKLSAGDELKINYWLTYDGNVQTSKIEIGDINGLDYEKGANGITGDILTDYPKDNYPDIKIKPTDGCNKSMFVLFNENKDKNYIPEYIDLTEIMAAYGASNQKNYDNTMSDITNTLSDNATSGDGPDMSSIPGLSDMLESWDTTDILGDTFDIDNIISQGGVDLSNIGNVPSQILDSLLGDTMDKVDELMGGLCNGFDLSKMGIGSSAGGCGLPVPFNQGFLGPGDYHLFGCFDISPLTETLGKGRPVLNIPGNRGPTAAGYLPFPGLFGLPFRGPTDGFLGGVKAGTYPSQFRLYLVPTLTAELGIAMCFGPYTVGDAIPDPVSSIAGNCIVTSIPFPCKNNDNGGPNKTNEIPAAFLDLNACTNQNKPCYIGPGESSSSLELVSNSDNNTTMTSAIPDGSFAGGFINIEKTPVTEYGYKTPESGIDINGVELFGGADAKNKIRGGMAQGLIKKLAKNWMDKQINYIISNLTNFKVDVYWPDFGKIMGGMGHGGLSKAMEDEKIKDCYDQKGTRHKVDDNNKAYCEVSEKQKCKNRGKDAKLENGEWICVKKPNPNQNDDAFGAIDSLAQNNLLDREQITNLENSSFANPFEKIAAMFDEVPLINIRTENITVKVPMISNEDISAYMNMSRNWIKVQEKTLKEWTDLLKAIIGFCGGSKNINNLKELKDAYSELKDKLKQEIKDNKDNLDSDDASSSITSIENKIKQIKNLNKIYNLNDLGDYEIYESDDIGKFWIKVDGITNVGQIIPQEVYLAYNPDESDPMEAMTMGTKGYDIEMSDKIGKIKISYTRNKDTYSNQHIHKKTIATSNQNQCANLFLGGKFDLALNNFINIQTSTDGLISSVRQNLEILELYKKFPLDLYEWIHVGDRYMSEISSIINNFLGTLSLWMNTNATRYSQYVDSLIMIMTTIQTYQAIIDLSVNWSEKCSSCTNDNYDQFACKLSLLCPDNLPIFKIPPMKIPSIYIDLSHMNLATDIKLPKFNFVPTTVALPSLPNIPKPPQIDFSLSLKDSLDLGINIMGELDAKLDNINLGITLPTIPVIPSPPDLPKIPSFLPSVKMELPLLPPAPKIPKLPNEISAAIDTADVIGQVMCIVKGNIGLVGEGSIKAKVEQMTQRTYEVPYWDDIDQTLSEWNTEGKSKIPDWITNMFGFLKSNEFQDVELQGFDFGIDSYVNLQYNFAGFYDFIDQIVGNVNKYSGMPSEFIQDQVNDLDNKSRDLEKQMSACTNNPISEACMGDAYTGDIKKFKEWTDKTENQLQTMGNYIENGFGGVKEAMQKIAMAENKKDDLLAINAKLGSGGNTGITATQTIIHNRETIKELNKEILDLNNKYGDAIEAYELYLTKYGKLLESLNKIKNKLSGVADDALNTANDFIGEANGAIDGGDGIIGDQLKKLQDAIDKQTKDFDTKQIQKKDIRNSWLDGLKKNVEIPQSYTDGISYVDFDKKTYQNNLEILQNSLNEIKSKTSNESFKKEIDSYLKLSKANKNIVPATDKINNIMNQYTDIINNYKSKNDTIIDNIGNDYDKFLFAVAQNDVQLVGNNDVDISLSSNLFDIDKDSLKMLDKQNSIDKIYLDYNNKNINGYLKAIESNSPSQLNMGDKEYNLTKKYLYDLKGKTELAYNILDNKKIITQNTTNNTNAGNQAGATTDISSYIDGKVIKTPNGSIDLANDKYVKDFQGKNILTDINNDGKDDLILRDKNNVYIKYKDQNRSYDNKEYNNRYYKYDISSYEDLVKDSDEGFVHINDIYIKLCDINWEIKNFRYNGGDFDSIKVAWMNSKYMGDKPAGYLIKMIHRVDLFNDKEINISKNNKKNFDKKYILALPKGSQITGTKIMLEEGTYRTESLLDGLIFDVMEYNENMDTINLTIKDIPRNWQYSEIYTLESYKDSIYMINNSSSNQIVAGPQIIADTKGPIPEIVLYRPAIKSVIDTGEQFKGFVGTNYILKSNWEDNVSIEKLWIADEYGNIISDIDDINEKTGYIELGGLFFTGVNTMNYYFGATDINGNSEVTQVTLQINVPTIEIVDIQKYGNDTKKQINNIDNISAPATITAQIEHDIDEGYVIFDRYRNNIRQTITGSLGGIKIDKYNLKPNQTIITGGYYDFGDDIGLYTNDGQLAVKINPNNGKINILNGFENIIKIKLDYSNKTPIIKIMEKEDILFVLSFPTKELIELSSILDIQELKGDVFGTFNGGKAIIDNDNTWIYIGPHGEIYTEGNVYGDYTFDDADQSIKYSFKKAPDSEILGYIKIKIKNLFGKEK